MAGSNLTTLQSVEPEGTKFLYPTKKEKTGTSTETRGRGWDTVDGSEVPAGTTFWDV